MDMADIRTRVERIVTAMRSRPETARHRWSVSVGTSDGVTVGVDDGRHRFESAIHPFGGRDDLPGATAMGCGAMGQCLVAGYLKQFAMRGLDLRSVQISFELEIDNRGPFEISDEVPVTFQEASYSVRLDCDATDEQLAEIAAAVERTSPWLNAFTNAVAMRRGEVVSAGRRPAASP